MTKVSVFGQETEKKKGKPIEFVNILENDTSIKQNYTGLLPKDFTNVVLVTKNHNGQGMDVILAYQNESRYISQEGFIQKAIIFLGHWNDGFVE